MADFLDSWAQNPYVMLGASMLAGSDPRAEGFGGIGRGVLGAVAQRDDVEDRRRAKLMADMQLQQLQGGMERAEQGREWIRNNKPWLDGAPQAYQNAAMGADFRVPSDFEKKWQLAGGDPAQYRATFGPGTGATVVMPGANYADKTMYETRGKAIEGRRAEYGEAAKKATDLQSQINRFNMAMERHGKTGNDEAMKKTVQEYASMFGFPVDTKSLSRRQDIEMAGRSMVAEQLRMNVGPQTDFDAKFTMSYMPGLQNTTEANRTAGKYSSSVNKLNQIYGRMANSVYRGGGGFDAASEKLDSIDAYRQNVPAVINAGDGWVLFDDYYREGKRQKLSDEEILNTWMSDYEQVR